MSDRFIAPGRHAPIYEVSEEKRIYRAWVRCAVTQKVTEDEDDDDGPFLHIFPLRGNI